MIIKNISHRRAHNFDDKTGRRFGKLTALNVYGYQNQPNGKKIVLWECKCDCGKTIVKTAALLSAGQILSCGCAKTERSLFFKEKPKFAVSNSKTETKYLLSGLSQTYRSYIAGAKRRKIKFNLTIDEFLKLSQGNCYYCGQEPSTFFRCRYKGSEYGFYYNGVDRKDSKVGYIADNCISCCANCNYAKRETDYKTFLSNVKRIYLKHFSSNHAVLKQ